MLAASCLAFAHSIWFAWAYFQTTPWLDMWDWVGEFRAWPDGNFGWRDLIAQHNDHRIATARLLFLADTLFFHMSGRFVTAANMALLVALGLLLHRAWRSRAVSRTPADLPAMFFIAIMASVCQWENLVTPFQVQFALLLVFTVLATILLVRGTSPDLPKAQALATMLAAACAYDLAAFSMAAGILLLPVLFGLLAVRRAAILPALCFAIPALLALVPFFHGYDWHSFGIVPLKIPGLTWPMNAKHMATVGVQFLGSAFGGLGGATAACAGMAGLALLCGHAVRAWRSGRKLSGAQAVFFTLAIFVLANAAAAARLRVYFGGGLAPRYAALSLLFFVSLAGLTAQARRPGALAASAAPVLALLALAAFNLPPVYAQQASNLRRALQIAGTTLQQGVYAPSRIGILNPFGLYRVIGPVRYAEHHRLSVFAASLRPPARIRALLRRIDPARLQTCLGAENSFYRLDSHRAILRAWLATPDPRRTLSWVELRGDGGQSEAVLPAQELREDIPLGPAHAPVMGLSAGFTATLGDGPLTLIGVPASGQPCRLTVPGPGPVRIQAPPDQLPDPAPILGLRNPGGAWAPSGPGLAAPWQDAKTPSPAIWTSAARGHAATGDLTMRIAAPPAGAALAVPFATGPGPDGLSLVFQAQDGQSVDLPIPADGQPGQWRLAALPPDFLARHPGPVTLIARDQGQGAGQWLAIAAPVCLRLDPDAAALDHAQPSSGWPALPLVPAG